MPDDAEILRNKLAAAQIDLVNRRDTIIDPSEVASLTDTINKLQVQIDLLDQQGLLAAAGAVAVATTSLQNVIADVHTDPIQQFIAQMNRHLEQLGVSHAAVHAALVPGPAPAPPVLAPTGATPVSHSTRFRDLAEEYSAMFRSCVTSPDKAALVQHSLSVLRDGRARYTSVAARFNSMPWYFVGITHGMEGSFNFRTHLHNGDPLTARTVHVPAGRPPTGSPPFTWEASAQDALAFENFDREGDFALPRILFLFEHFNGMGYRQFGLASPYLWSFSNHYAKGKFGQDGKFDPELVSKQVGAAVLLKALQDSGETIT
jgi:lysozyme family protein